MILGKIGHVSWRGYLVGEGGEIWGPTSKGRPRGAVLAIYMDFGEEGKRREWSGAHRSRASLFGFLYNWLPGPTALIVRDGSVADLAGYLRLDMFG